MAIAWRSFRGPHGNVLAVRVEPENAVPDSAETYLDKRVYR